MAGSTLLSIDASAYWASTLSMTARGHQMSGWSVFGPIQPSSPRWVSVQFIHLETLAFRRELSRR